MNLVTMWIFFRDGSSIGVFFFFGSPYTCLLRRAPIIAAHRLLGSANSAVQLRDRLGTLRLLKACIFWESNTLQKWSPLLHWSRIQPCEMRQCLVICRPGTVSEWIRSVVGAPSLKIKRCGVDELPKSEYIHKYIHLIV